MTAIGMNSESFKRILTRNVVLPLILTVLLSLVFGGLLMSLLNAYSRVTHSDVAIQKSNTLIKLIIDSETGVRGFLITGKDTYLEPHIRAQQVLTREFNELIEFVSDNPDQMRRLKSIQKDYLEWERFADATIEKKRAKKYSFGEDSDLRKSFMDQIRSEVNQFLLEEERLRDERTSSTNDRTRLVLILTAVMSVLVGGGLAWLGRKQLLTLSRNYEEALRLQTEQTEALERQAWIRNGQTELSEKIQGDFTVEEISNRIVGHLAAYLGSPIGAFYSLRERGNLVRTGGFAYAAGEESAQAVPKNFRFGEGVVGQVAQNRKLVVLDQLPENYIQIRSALGRMTPRHLVVVPLLADNAVQGVLELGFNDPVSVRALELLRQASEIMGSALKSAHYRMRLEELLAQAQAANEELQTQQEELQAQQEELRVSNEELAERSKALTEAQARLQGQHSELEQTNTQLESQAQLLESQKLDLDQRNQALENARHSIEEKARELEAASAYKSEFLANMSHELRTPLNSSLILAKLLKDNPSGNLSDEQVEFASTIYSAGNDLLNLINDILDLSKVEAGKLEVQAEKVKIAHVVQSLERSFKPLANDKRLKLEMDIAPGCPDTIVTDRLRLEQVLKNLLSNALKFTKSGTVRLAVRPEGAEAVAFAVSDTGVGIDPAQHGIIFEAFRQADGTTNRKYGGTGLGLSISRNLAQLLGGSIMLESELEKGSTFTLLLPNAYSEKSDARSSPSVPVFTHSVAPAPAPRKPTNEPLLGPPPFSDDRESIRKGGGRVLLVVEDEEAFAKIVYNLAHEMSFQCLVADNTADGYLLATQFVPNAIILDIKLPDASGLSLLDRLKANPSTRHIPVHAISGADYSREALHLGAIGYLQKPAEMSALKATFGKIEEKLNQQIKRVLIVEDDPVQRMSMERLIGEKGVEIITASEGEDGLEKLKKFNFDCVIIDLSLPDMSGFELLERMAQDHGVAFPPVIVYTARALTLSEEDRLRRYSRTIIIKGARSPERLLDEVTLFLHQVESKLSPERQKILRESRGRDRAFEDRQILVVDDDVRNIYALTSALERQGAKVIAARHGKEALTKLEENPGVELVLMDIMMPEMDGYQAMREIRKNPAHATLPILAVTAKAMKDDYDQCLAAGANDYMAKPIDLDKLVSLMRVWLPKPGASV